MPKTKERKALYQNSSFALSLAKKEQFTRKTKERIPNPGFHAEIHISFGTVYDASKTQTSTKMKNTGILLN